MKVTQEHLDAMREAIEPLDERARQRYCNGNFPRSHRVKDLNKRYRWDLFYASKACQVVRDAGYKDAHIDTALRQIVRPL